MGKDETKDFVINPMADGDDTDAATSPKGSDVAEALPVTIAPANHLWAPEPMHPGLRGFIGNPLAEGFVVGVIAANTILMLIFHPNNPVSQETQDLLAFTDLIFTIFYTSESAIRIMGFGFWQDGLDEQGNPSPLIEYDSYMSSNWNKLDLFVVTTAWATYMMEIVFSYSGIISKTSMLRALRVLRIMHAFRFLSGIRAILASLGRAAEGMGNICLMFFFFFSIYAIVGMALFGGSLRTQCVTQAEADACECCADGMLTVNGTDGCLATGELAPCPEKTNAFIRAGKTCDVVTCPGSITCDADAGNVCMLVGYNSRGGMAGYDNVMAAFLSLFIATTGDNWQDITWVYKWSPTTTSSIAYPFFVSIQILLTMTAMNIFVAVICGAFDEVRAESHHSAFAESDEEEEEEADSGDAEEEEDDGSEEWIVPRPKGWVAPPYQSDGLERLTEKASFDGVSTFLIGLNVITLSMNTPLVHWNNPALAMTLEWVDVGFTLLFDIEMIIKICGLGFKRYWGIGFNKVDTFVNITCTIALVCFLLEIEGEGLALIKVFRLSRILRVMRLLGKIEMVRELLSVVLGSWVAVINLCVFIVYCLFVFALFGMHMMGDMSQFDDLTTFLDEGTGDPGLVPRPTFQSFLMAFSTCFLMMTGDRWKVTMYTYMQTYGTTACVFFIGLWMLCNCVLLNLFVAVVVENFSLAEEDMIKKQKQKYKKQNTVADVKNGFRAFAMKYLGMKDSLEKIDEEVGPGGKAFFCFTPDNPVRKCCGAVSKSAPFEYFIMFLIIANSCMIAYEGPPGTIDRDTMSIFESIDLALLGIFWIEFFMKSIDAGFLFTQEAYMSSHWNKMDFIIIFTALLAHIFSGSPAMAEAAQIFRLFRLLRPLRLLNRIEGMKHIIEALISSAGGLFGVGLLGAVFYVMFAILGVNLFGGKFFKCDNGEVFGRYDCVGSYTYEAECPEAHSFPNDGKKCVYMGAPRWRIAYSGGEGDWGFSFDDIGSALQTLFLVGTCAGWSECLYLSMDTVGIDMQPQRNANPHAAIFYIVFLFICSFALVNLFVGVLIYLFGVSSGTSLQTEAQQKWALMKSVVKAVDNIGEEIVAPAREGGIRMKAFELIKKPWFDQLITGTILFNVMVMMANYYPEPESWSATLEVLNYLCLLIFTLEMAAKLLGLGPVTYIKDNWNKIDCFVVLSSYFFIVLAAIGQGSPILGQMAKCLRVGRIVLLVKRAKGLQQIFQLFFISIPAACNVLMLLMLVFFIYACLGMYMFGHLKTIPGFDTMPDGRGVRAFCPDNERGLLGEADNIKCGFGNYDNRGNFKSFGNAMMLLFQVASGEDFLFIVPELRLSPPYCIAAGSVARDMDVGDWLLHHDWADRHLEPVLRLRYDTIGEMFDAGLALDDLESLGVPDDWQEEVKSALLVDEYGNCGSSYAFAFIASFYLLASWLLLNMVIGVIMENHENIKAAERLELTNEDIQAFMDEWTFQTQTGNGEDVGRMPTSRMKSFLSALPEDFVEQPFGAAEYAEVLHVLEQQFHMTFEEQNAGYTVKQLLKVLMIIKAGGHLALSIEEQIENEKKTMADMHAKLVIGTVRSWIKVKEDPALRDTARVALTFRMTSLARRKVAVDLDEEETDTGAVAEEETDTSAAEAEGDAPEDKTE
jgi:voltage-dependent calcium channel L type alpha-1D